MDPGAPPDATLLLNRIVRGDRRAGDALLPLLYDELYRLARQQMGGGRGHHGHTLQPTALVHEAWLRLIDRTQLDLPSRGHFFALAARAMRSVLVDHARRRGAVKRGSGRAAADAGVADVQAAAADPDAVLDLDQALERLAVRDPELGRLVELHVFGGLTHAQCAELLGVSLSSVERGWRLARAWLRGELEGRSAGHA